MPRYYFLACLIDGTVVQCTSVSLPDGETPLVPDHWVLVDETLYNQVAPGSVIAVTKGVVSVPQPLTVQSATRDTGVVPGAPTVKDVILSTPPIVIEEPPLPVVSALRGLISPTKRAKKRII